MIRLLPDEDNDALIKCTLFNYTLARECKRRGNNLYEALSYVWGSGVKSESVILDGSPYLVTKSLHAALLYHRDCQLDRILWIDALSINQEDADEKSRQIPLMRMIYAQASCVIVWLGEATKERDGGLEYIRHISEDKVRKGVPTDAKNMRVHHAACLVLPYLGKRMLCNLYSSCSLPKIHRCSRKSVLHGVLLSCVALSR